MSQEIWQQKSGVSKKPPYRPWSGEVAKLHEIQAVFPNLAEHLEAKDGFEYDDEVYTYTVRINPGYDPSVWRKKSRGGNRSNRYPTTKSPAQTTLTDTDVKYEELVAKLTTWTESVDTRLARIMEKNGIPMVEFNHPSRPNLSNHGNEEGGDSAAGTGIDTLNAMAEVGTDGLPQPETPQGVTEIDAIAGQEQDQ